MSSCASIAQIWQIYEFNRDSCNFIKKKSNYNYAQVDESHFPLAINSEIKGKTLSKKEYYRRRRPRTFQCVQWLLKKIDD